MLGSQIGCHFYFGRMAVLMAVPETFRTFEGLATVRVQPVVSSCEVTQVRPAVVEIAAFDR
jgi:hypothetical protein